MSVTRQRGLGPKQREINDVEPAQNAVDDRPEKGVVIDVGDRDRQRRAKPDAVFCALNPNSVVAIAVHVAHLAPCRWDQHSTEIGFKGAGRKRGLRAEARRVALSAALIFRECAARECTSIQFGDLSRCLSHF